MKSSGEVVAMRQGGGSTIGNLIILAVIGFGIWVGVQYIPQRIEAATIRSIVEQVEQRHLSTPIRDDQDLWVVVGKQLSINDMNDMREHFKASWNQGQATLTVSYERDLNLLFTTRTIEYREEVVLD